MRTDLLLYVTLLIFLLSGSLCQSEELICLTDLGTLGGSDSLANGINDAGQIIGWSHTSGGESHAVLWENGESAPKDLGILGGNNSTAYEINGAGQIVGGSDITGDLLYHAVRWQNGVMQDLGTLGGSESEAFGINEAGQIVGVSSISISSDEFHAFSTSRCTRGLTWLMLLLD